MTLTNRLKRKGEEGELSDRQVDALLAGTKMVLEALRADLQENEPQAGATAECILETIEALPETIADVKDLDRWRETGQKTLRPTP